MTAAEQIVFDLYKAGKTHSEIVKALDKAGHKTPTGKDHSDPSVAAIVSKLGIANRSRQRRSKQVREFPSWFINDVPRINVGFTSNIPIDIDSDYEDNLGFPGAEYKGPI